MGFRSGHQGEVIPPGSAAGDILVWDGSAWVASNSLGPALSSTVLVADYSNATGAMTDILSLAVVTRLPRVWLVGSAQCQTLVTTVGFFDLQIDGATVNVGGTNAGAASQGIQAVTLQWQQALAPGAHTFKLRGRTSGGGTLILRPVGAGAGTEGASLSLCEGYA